ncbi:MAG: Eco57I restriction-modification methylase domain-containing protein [Faecalibacterium sp.]|jgi:type II restriction enzyme|nr:Eco57I restriction-modification methylase domain-containing protein [Faecalibacterium sp.]
MKFDFAIGNPPYQDEVQNKGDRPNPVYDKFMDASYEIADTVELIHPGRFLFEAGQTPKAWNRKMLKDEHFSVLSYESDSSKVFPGVDLKGGVAITIHNKNKKYGATGTFTSHDELNSIAKKIAKQCDDLERLNSIIASQGLYRFSDVFFKEHPASQRSIGAGTGNKIVSNVITKFPDVFYDEATEEKKYVRFLGRVGNKRVYKYIRRDYLESNEYIDKYNIFIPEANNSGQYGETLTEPIIGLPGDASADTFLSAGKFNTREEAESLIKYIKTKFFRALLGIRKVTQHCPPSVWKMIPVQNFTLASDIDWSQSIAGIDQQLYKKYDLSTEEINFIETHVKEMV